MNRASSATGWVRNPIMKSPDLDPHLASSYELGWTFNPITGCLNGCEYCYARKLANGRLKSRYLANMNIANIRPEEYSTAMIDPFYPRFWGDRLEEPMVKAVTRGRTTTINVGKQKGIFVCDMSDLFGFGIPEEWTRKVLQVIEDSPHRFYLLTKQPQNLIKFSPFPDNCWVGVTATNASDAIEANKSIAQINAKVKYLSIEPMQYWRLFSETIQGIISYYDWVILGSQTRPYQPPAIEDVKDVVEACDKAGTPVFLKNNLKPLIESQCSMNDQWATKEWVMCKYPVLRQEMPGGE